MSCQIFDRCLVIVLTDVPSGSCTDVFNRTGGFLLHEVDLDFGLSEQSKH